MKKQELRINSFYYSVKFDIPVTLDISDLTQLDHNRDGAELDSETIGRMFQSILLTEEWLLKFGFEKKSEYVFKIVNLDLNYQFTITRTGKGFNTPYANLNYSIQYVHQLQNLYSALTGEELTIK